MANFETTKRVITAQASNSSIIINEVVKGSAQSRRVVPLMSVNTSWSKVVCTQIKVN